MNTSAQLDWRLLLQEALSEPGRISEAYSMFHQYSFGNAMWVSSQLRCRKLPISPVASFNHWKKLERQVKKGEKALMMLMPRMRKKVLSEKDSGSSTEEEKYIFSGFMIRRYWFSLYQTEGKEYVPDTSTGMWNSVSALKTLEIEEEVFSLVDGNCMGYAKPNKSIIAINPLNPFPWKTRFHELAHCLLHKRDELFSDNHQPEYSLDEVEAESVAYLCCAALNLTGTDESRGYIQLWMNRTKSGELKEENIQRIFRATSRILSAGNAETLK